MNIGKRLAGIVAAAAISVWSQYAQGGIAPELGVTWTFDCGPDSPWNERYTFTPKAVEDDVLLMEWTAGDQTGSLSTPVAALLAGFQAKKVLGDKTTRQVIEHGSLSFETLEVGEEVTAWVRQFDSKWGRNRWQWSARITDRITVETPAFGTLDALIIEKNRYSQEWGYGSRNLTHFALELNFPIYWKYSDTNNNVEECRLVSRNPAWQPPGATHKASGSLDEKPGQTARLTPSDQPPVKSKGEVEAYLDENEWDIRHKLDAYNKKRRVLVGNNNSLSVRKVGSTQVMDLQGDSVFLEIHFQVGRQAAATLAGVGTFLFELKWIDGDLEFVGHGEHIQGPETEHQRRPDQTPVRRYDGRWTAVFKCSEMPRPSEFEVLIDDGRMLATDHQGTFSGFVDKGGNARISVSSVLGLFRRIHTVNADFSGMFSGEDLHLETQGSTGWRDTGTCTFALSRL
jgi:hypothetical protein